jgi:hypothetical protein
MRGYGRSSVYAQHADYAVENSVHDMIELLDSLGRESLRPPFRPPLRLAYNGTMEHESLEYKIVTDTTAGRT